MVKKEWKKYEQLVQDGVKIWQLAPEDRPKGIHIVGIIPDTHAPWHHKKTIDFLVKNFQLRGVTEIVHIGDMLDMYWRAKKYIKDYRILGPMEEYKAAKKFVKQLYDEFPYVKYVIGNHDLRLTARNNDDFGDDFITTFRDDFDIPLTWDIRREHIIDNVCYVHGIGASGQNAALIMLRTKRMSTVIGHTHSFASIQYSNNGLETNFAMNVGCLIDLKAPVFDYGVNNREKPVLACGVVYNSQYAEVIPYV